MAASSASSAALGGITQYVFDATLTSREEIEQFLADKATGTAHPIDNGRALVVKMASGGFERRELAGVDSSAFLNLASLSALEESILVQLNKYPALAEFASYTVQAASPGELIDLPIDPSRIMCFVATNKSGDMFFDLSVYNMVPAKRAAAKNKVGGDEPEFSVACVTYSAQRSFGVCHSGDIGALLHHIKLPSTSAGQQLMFTVVGFRRQPLHSFASQQPTVFLLNHDTRTLTIVPCPLDLATIGTATLSGLVYGIVSDDARTLQCCVLPAPVTVADADTGDVSLETRVAMGTAVTFARQAMAFAVPAGAGALAAAVGAPAAAAAGAARAAPATAAAAAAAAAAARASAARATVELPPALAAAPMIHMVENGLRAAFRSLDAAGIPDVFFGTGFAGVSGGDALTVRLPHVFGPASGVAACALGRSPALPFSGAALASALACKLTLIEFSEEWLESVATSALAVGNALGVLHARVSGTPAAAAALATLDSPSADSTLLVELLNACVLTGACMLGPCSLLVVCLNERMFFLRGVRLAGLVDTLPPFGGELTAQLSRDALVDWAAGGGAAALPWPRVLARTDAADPDVFFGGAMGPLTAAQQWLTAASLETVGARQADVLDLLAQVAVALKPDAVKRFRDAMDLAFGRLLDASLGAPKREVAAGVREVIAACGGALTDAARVEIGRLRGSLTVRTKAATAVLQPIMAALANLVSARGASTMAQSIKRRARAAAISSNVEAAKTMTLAQKAELLEDVCGEYGLLVVAFDTEHLRLCLTKVGAGVFNAFASERLLDGTDGIRPSPRMPAIDALTLGTLLEIAAGDPHAGHPLHCPDGSGVALAVGTAADEAVLSTLAFPLHTEHVDAVHPSTISWPEVANLAPVATWRILIRQTIANSLAARALAIDSGSKDLGFFMLHVELSAMEAVAAGMTLPVGDRSATTAQWMRGMFGQVLALAASTAGVLCPVFPIVNKHSFSLQLLPADQWWVLVRMLRLFAYTGWDEAPVQANAMRLVVKAVRRYVTGAATDAMASCVSQAKAVATAAALAARGRALAFARVAVTVVLRAARAFVATGAPLAADVAARTLAHRPLGVALPDSIASLVRALERAAAGKVTDWNKFFFLPGRPCVRSALKLYARRSRFLADAKREVRAAMIAMSPAAVASAFANYRAELALLTGWIPDEYAHIRAPLPVPNGSAFVEGDAAHSLVTVSADTDLRFAPWSLDSSALPPLAPIVAEIFGDAPPAAGSAAADAGAAPADEAGGASAAPRSPLDELATVMGSERAVELIRSTLPALRADAIPRMPDGFTRILAYCGLTELDAQSAAVRAVAERLVFCWQTGDGGETEAVAALERLCK